MKFGFFFGAGAELCYGLPSGGEFAIGLFRQDVSQQKEQLKNKLQHDIDPTSLYATGWLPPCFDKKRIHAFGKNEFSSLIESSIEYKKSDILNCLNTFDEQADKAMSDLNINRETMYRLFKEKTENAYGSKTYSQAIRLNPILSQKVSLFDSTFYSGLLEVIRKDKNAIDIHRYAGAFLQLLVGAYGQDLIQNLNQELFTQAPDDITIFDDISGMFKLEFNHAGLTALDLLLDEKREYVCDEHANLNDMFVAISQKILENIFSLVLDYQSLIDNHFRYLYSPKTEWAKFTKMVIFLNSARSYIVEQMPLLDQLAGEGYYHDLKECGGLGIEISIVGTSNYNNLIKIIAENSKFALPEVIQLNGGVNDYYNPYKNNVITRSRLEDVPKNQIYVPFILTQSGLKPLTSIGMSKRYVNLFEQFQKSDAIVVIGYGFNIDDNHINGMFRQLIEDEGKKLYYLCGEGKSEWDQKRELCKKLRLTDPNDSNVHIIQIDFKTRKKENKLWLQCIVESYHLQ